eukprot:jgi/Mesvir1/1923/Mv22952-RA.1
MAEAAGSTYQYGNIGLVGKGSDENIGALKIHPGGFVWRKSGGGRIVELHKTDISGLNWVKAIRGHQLDIRTKAGAATKFEGFRDSDVEALRNFVNEHFGLGIKDKTLATSGRNWGEAAIDGSMLAFNVPGRKNVLERAFEVPLGDVSHASLQNKNEVMLQMHVDDTSNQKTSLVEMSFYVPDTNKRYAPEEDAPEGTSAAKEFLDRVLQRADVGEVGGEAVATFDEVSVMVPRGRYLVELHTSFLQLTGQNNDFKIQYASILRLFLLPKPNLPHTLVVASLDPPIRKGQTLYPHLLFQFPNEEETEVSLNMSAATLEAKYADTKLALHQSGRTHEIFARILKALSGAKLSKPSSFRSAHDGVAIRCSYRTEEGYLYPLERAFFGVHKPPVMIPYEDVESIEFLRHTQTSSTQSVRTFDVSISTSAGAEHQFRNIPRPELDNFLAFVKAKKIKIANIDADNLAAAAEPLAGMEDEDDDEDEEDEDFAEGGEGGDDEDDDEDAGSDAGSDEGSGSSGGSGSDAEDEEEKPKKRKAEEGKKKDKSPAKKAKGASGAPAAAKKKDKGKGDGDGDKKPAKKVRKKKDPNEPKRGLSAYMFYVADARAKLKAERPELSFGELGRVLGEQWKAMSEADKAPYEQKAAADKTRYSKAMAEYKAGGAGAGAAAGEDGGEEEEAASGSEGGDE